MRWWAGWATPTAPALLGNTVVWKPSPTQELAAHLTMGLLAEACLPPGVINLVTGDDRAVSEVALADPELAGLHFTGSTATFKLLWRTVADHLDGYRAIPGWSARPAARTSPSPTLRRPGRSRPRSSGER